tara:strand:+ start:333 stop:452 length:120 start_codon:yes stop_codon:yes gene_type:complete
MDSLTDLELDQCDDPRLKTKIEEIIIKVNEIVTWINAQS